MPLLNKFFFLKTDLPQFFEIEKKMCVCEVSGKNLSKLLSSLEKFGYIN